MYSMLFILRTSFLAVVDQGLQFLTQSIAFSAHHGATFQCQHGRAIHFAVRDLQWYIVSFLPVHRRQKPCRVALRLSKPDEKGLATWPAPAASLSVQVSSRSEEHTSELQSPCNLVCRLLLEKKKKNNYLIS